jgi:hypothetical protein
MDAMASHGKTEYAGKRARYAALTSPDSGSIVTKLYGNDRTGD